MRDVHVYLPPDYEAITEPLIALWDLAAFTNSGAGHVAWRNHGENLPQRLDRLIGESKLPPVICVLPDCYTSLGGNQYVNSPAVGRYANYLVDELVPFISARYNVIEGRAGRAVFGKSSGGYGALYHAMHFSETWGAAASHAGDAGFDLVYQPGFPDACLALNEFGDNPQKFIRHFWSKNKPVGRDFSTMMTLAMAASYDPDPEAPDKIRLPFDYRHCQLDHERWKNWLAFDPVNMVDRCVAALKSLHGLYIDVGRQDQYFIQLGSRRLADKLEEHSVRYHYEEFDGTHSAIDWRLDYSLPFLVDALKKAVKEAN